ncbi:MAG: AI-2E family transporter [Acidobacteria bacterium]|nr:MAG: AI-2E family transporter [Acidobacteriota bacterium]
MPDDAPSIRWPRWLPWMVAVIAILVLYRLSAGILLEIGRVVEPVLVPLVLALALAYLLKPLVEWFERRLALNRQWAVLLALVVSVILLGIGLFFILPPLIAQLIESAQKLPRAMLSVIEWLKPYLEHLRERYPTAYETAMERVLAVLQPGPGGESLIARAIGQVASQVIGVTANVLNVILIPVFTFYILRDLEHLRQGIERLIPHRFRSRASRLFDRAGRVVSNFVRGQLTVAVILSGLYAVGFFIAGAPLALSLGVLAGFGYLIPYIGTLTAFVFTVLLVLLTHPGFWPVIKVVLVYLAVQSMEGLYLTPRIMGERLKLHPMLVIVGVIIGGNLFGILGIILALPVMALAKVLLEVAMEPYLASDYYMRASPPETEEPEPVDEPS